MPLYYDVTKACTTNGTGNTETTHLWGKTAANQETATILAVYPHAYNFGTSGSGGVRMKTNTGTTASGGNTTGLNGANGVAKNLRYGVAAGMTWAGDGAAITAGATLALRESIGFSQTGAGGGWVALTPQQGIQMMPNATNPVDVELTSIAFSVSVPFDLVVDFSEGV
jgi:hypothetical protein